MKKAWLNVLWLGSGNAAMFPWLHFKTPLWQLQPQTWWALMFCLCNEPPPPPQLKCNYHLADTKMRFLARGHSRCYLEFLNFRRGKKKRRFFSLSLLSSYFLGVSRKGRRGELHERVGGWRGRGGEKGCSRRRRGMIGKERRGRVSGRMR